MIRGFSKKTAASFWEVAVFNSQTFYSKTAFQKEKLPLKELDQNHRYLFNISSFNVATFVKAVSQSASLTPK